MKKILSVALLSISIISCSKETKLNGNKYILKSSNGSDILLTFSENENRISGKVVNNYFGNYEVSNDNKISFGPIASTMMMGPAKDMETEQNFFKFMNTVNNYEINENNLTLTGEDGSVMKFEKIQEIPSNLK